MWRKMYLKFFNVQNVISRERSNKVELGYYHYHYYYYWVYCIS